MAGKEKPKTPEQIRAERIASLKDSEARAAVEKIEKERKEQLAELRAYQRENFDKWAGQVARQREQYLNGPRHEPPGSKPGPVIDRVDKEKLRVGAEAEVHRQIKVQDQAKNLAFDRRVDRELDTADRRLERLHGHALQRESLHHAGRLDRGDR